MFCPLLAALNDEAAVEPLPAAQTVLADLDPATGYRFIVRESACFRYAGHAHETARVAGDVLLREEPCGVFAVEVPDPAIATAPPFAWLGVGLHAASGSGLTLFSILVQPTPRETVFSLLDPDRTPAYWQTRGRLLNREEALAQPRRAEFFAVAEAVLRAVPQLRVFCALGAAATPASAAAHPQGCTCAACGSPVRPLLDAAFRWPDAVSAIPAAERTGRVWHDAVERPDFVTIDQSRFFVRGLLPIPLPGGKEFRYGVWLEVNREEFARIRRVWSDSDAYAALRFRARLANAVPPWGQAVLNSTIAAATRRVSDRPYVVNAEEPALAEALRTGWDSATYERIARPYAE